MTIFSVYLPPDASRDNQNENFHLIPDSKAPLALIFQPFWLAWHGLWLEFSAYLVSALAILSINIWNSDIMLSPLFILSGFYLFLEGNELIRYKFERKDWQYTGIVEGENRQEAESRFLMNLPDSAIEESRKIMKTKMISPIANKPAEGLFPE